DPNCKRSSGLLASCADMSDVVSLDYRRLWGETDLVKNGAAWRGHFAPQLIINDRRWGGVVWDFFRRQRRKADPSLRSDDKSTRVEGQGGVALFQSAELLQAADW